MNRTEFETLMQARSKGVQGVLMNLQHSAESPLFPLSKIASGSAPHCTAYVTLTMTTPSNCTIRWGIWHQNPPKRFKKKPHANNPGNGHVLSVLRREEEHVIVTAL